MKFAKSQLKSLWNNVDEVLNVYLLLTLNKVSTLIWRFFSPTYYVLDMFQNNVWNLFKINKKDKRIINSEQISHILLMLPLLTLIK